MISLNNMWVCWTSLVFEAIKYYTLRLLRVIKKISGLMPFDERQTMKEYLFSFMLNFHLWLGFKPFIHTSLPIHTSIIPRKKIKKQVLNSFRVFWFLREQYSNITGRLETLKLRFSPFSSFYDEVCRFFSAQTRIL